MLEQKIEKDWPDMARPLTEWEYSLVMLQVLVL